MLVGITRRNSDSRRTSECDAFVDRVPGDDEIDAQMSFTESVQEDLQGSYTGGGKRNSSRKKKPSASVPVAGPRAAAGARPVYKM